MLHPTSCGPQYKPSRKIALLVTAMPHGASSLRSNPAAKTLRRNYLHLKISPEISRGG